VFIDDKPKGLNIHGYSVNIYGYPASKQTRTPVKHMQTKKVLLTINTKFFDHISVKADERSMSIQEYIYDTLRDRVYATPALPTKKSNAGRPKKVDDPFIQHFT